MVKKVWLGLAIIGIGVSLGLAQYASLLQPSSTAAPSKPVPRKDVPIPSPGGVPTPNTEIEYKSYNLPSSIVHTLWIPAKKFVVTSLVADGVETVETIAQKQGAIAVLNGGFFDPANQQSTSFVTVQGKLVADPRLNKRLVNNPDLAPYLDKIFDRSEFRRYQCGEKVEYAIVYHRQPTPANCQLVDALGGGPQLLMQTNAAVFEGFVVYDNGSMIRDSLGWREPNARTAIGLTENGAIVWVMVAQKPNAPAPGMSLETLPKFMATLGVSIALNLDGGSSSSLYYNGKAFYGKVDADGKPIKRPVKSVLIVKKNR